MSQFKKIWAPAVALALVMVVAMAWAEEKAPRRTLEARTTFEGTFACVACTLEDRGADAQCSLHSKHGVGLLAADGELWTFVDNVRGHAVIRDKELRGKKVKLIGWRFPKARYIEVSKFQLEEDGEWVTYDFCKICGFEEGDHDGTDLCEDCADEEGDE